MIYNKKLGISDEMINNEEDMDVVMGWRREIEAEIVEFNLRTANYPELSRNQKKARAILYSLRLLCKSRMSLYDLQLKEEGKWKSPREVKSDRYLASVFMEVAKKQLPKPEYRRLLEAAQELVRQRQTAAQEACTQENAVLSSESPQDPTEEEDLDGWQV